MPMGPRRARFVAALPLGDTTVLITGGEASLRRGRARAILLDELAELARAEGIENACIHAVTGRTDFQLKLHGVPERLAQRFRNVWAAHWP